MKKQNIENEITIYFNDPKVELNNTINIMKQGIKNEKDQNGYIRNVKQAFEGVYRAYSLANFFNENGLYYQAILIHKLIIDELEPLTNSVQIQFSDEVYYLIARQYNKIEDILLEKYNQLNDNKHKCFDLLISAYNERKNIEFLYYTLNFIHEFKYRVKLDEVIKSLEKSISNESFNNDDMNEEILKLRLDFLIKIGKVKPIIEFINKNHDFKILRDIGIDYAFGISNFYLVIELTLEGEKLENEPRKVLSLKCSRYKAYKLLHDIKSQIQIGYELILMGDLTYYDEIKALYNKNEWNIVLTKLLKEIKHDINYVSILRKEKQYELLLDYCKNNVNYILDLYPDLIDKYHDDVREIFNLFIENELLHVVNRTHLKIVCDYLEIYYKLFGLDNFLPLFKKIKHLFSKNNPFIDELDLFINRHKIDYYEEETNEEIQQVSYIQQSLF